MIYINDPKQKAMTYDEVVAVAIDNGVEAKRVYLYLMALGVKGMKARRMTDNMSYAPVANIATFKGEIIKSATPCKHCPGLVFTTVRQ